jgi:hypothetical protein
MTAARAQLMSSFPEKSAPVSGGQPLIRQRVETIKESKKHKMHIPESLPMRGKAKYTEEEKQSESKKARIEQEQPKKPAAQYLVKSSVPNEGNLNSLLRQKPKGDIPK